MDKKFKKNKRSVIHKKYLDMKERKQISNLERGISFPFVRVYSSHPLVWYMLYKISKAIYKKKKI